MADVGDVQLWLVPAKQLNSSEGYERGAANEERHGRSRGKRESCPGCRRDKDAAEARSRVDWPEEDEETA